MMLVMITLFGYVHSCNSGVKNLKLNTTDIRSTSHLHDVEDCFEQNADMAAVLKTILCLTSVDGF